jgi:dihydroorotate dehydrogenase electron transfer subunit
VILDSPARVIANTRFSTDFNVLAIDAAAIAESSQPGQFVMVKIARGQDPLLRRPFSVFEVLREHNRVIGFSILNKRIGPSTRLLFEAEAGDRIQVLGPLGRPFVPPAPGAHAWMVAGGVGLAPFAAFAETLAARSIPARLFYGARRAEELLYLDWFAERGVELTISTEDGSKGVRGRVTVPLQQALSSADSSRDVVVYACGPEPMLAAVSKMAAAAKRRVQVSVERIMGCGLGGCYSCVIPLRDVDGPPHFVRSCLDGPVFDGSVVAW